MFSFARSFRAYGRFEGGKAETGPREDPPRENLSLGGVLIQIDVRHLAGETKQLVHTDCCCSLGLHRLLFNWDSITGYMK